MRLDEQVQDALDDLMYDTGVESSRDSVRPSRAALPLSALRAKVPLLCEQCKHPVRSERDYVRALLCYAVADADDHADAMVDQRVDIALQIQANHPGLRLVVL